jgi:hypothetical protein
MRITTSFRYAMVVLALGALTAATPRPADARVELPRATASTPEAWAGIYRLTLISKTQAPMPVRLLVERDGETLTGTLLSDIHGAAHAALRLDGDVLRASTQTSRGQGELVLRETSEGITGTFTVGKQVWTVTGTRSS